MQALNVDLLMRGGIIVCMDANRTVIHNGTIAVKDRKSSGLAAMIQQATNMNPPRRWICRIKWSSQDRLIRMGIGP